MNHDIIWTHPPPLWASPAVKFIPERSGILEKPAILRFGTDSFMDDFLNVLATEPERLGEFGARPETWRGFTPPPEPQKPRPPSAVLRHLRLRPRSNGNGSAHSPAPAAATSAPLKLYQPAHQRHYLVTSSLVCRVPGLPDRGVDSARSEKVGFVMRRLLPPALEPDLPVSDWEEHGWVVSPRGATWQQVGPTSAKELVEGEEVIPMFGVHFDEPGLGRKRRVFAGVIPAGKREAYLGAARSTGSSRPPGVTARTARKILLRKEIIEPWKSLVDRAGEVRASLTQATGSDRLPTAAERIDRLKAEREQIQTVSWLILLDLARYLKTYLSPVWRAVIEPLSSGTLSPAEEAVLTALEGTPLATALRTDIRHRERTSGDPIELYASSAVPSNLRQALARYGTGRDGLDASLERQLENQDLRYDRHSSTSRAAWPGFLFPLADPWRPQSAPRPPALTLGDLNDDETELYPGGTPGGSDVGVRIDRLAVLIVRALGEPDAGQAPEPDVPAAAIAPVDALRGWFVIRCVYERPACEPLHQEVVSEPTEPFELAGFFDPDAPARPIRIGLPLDTSPAGLRKFDRNTAFVISDVLCGQIKRLRGLTLGDLVRSVLPWPLHKPLPVPDGGACKTGGGDSLGMICSLSIPIVTICALVLLMIMVKLLDFVFSWIPFFISCFPIPGLKARPEAPSTS
jgi:hypothetical protein